MEYQKLKQNIVKVGFSLFYDYSQHVTVIIIVAILFQKYLMMSLQLSIISNWLSAPIGVQMRLNF